MWHDLAAALALVLILEGILPFVNPDAVRRAMQAIQQMGDNQLRTVGLASMLIGLLLLFFVNRY